MRIVVTAANGLFGSGIVKVLRGQHDLVPLTRADADITNQNEIRATLHRVNPDVVIHTAANPDPDYCQLHPEEARGVNVGGTKNVVAAAKEFGFALAFISTDAVFDGAKSTPYVETDPPHPISVYGETKLAAEGEVRQLERHWIFRVSVLFGPGRDSGGSPGKLNFIEKGLRKIANGESYVVASDQVGSATYTLDAAQSMQQVIESQRYGLYHLSNQGSCSRIELAQRAAQLAGFDPSLVKGLPLDQMGRPGPRPKYAVMQMQAVREAGFTLPRPWEKALTEYVNQFWRA